MMTSDVLVRVTDNSLALTEKLTTELKTFAEEGDRREFLGRIRELFLASRAEASTQSESVRARALKVLESKLDTLPAHMLVRVIEMLTESNSTDVTSFLGGSNTSDKGGITINNLMSQTSPTSSISPNISSGSVRNPLQDGGELLEALGHIGNYLKEKSNKEELNTIDITPEVVDQ